MNGTQTKEKVGVMKGLQTVMSIKENIKMAKHMEKEFSIGNMERFMMVNGFLEPKKAMGFGKVLKETLILGNGRIAKLKAMEYMFGKMEIDMRESGRRA